MGKRSKKDRSQSDSETDRDLLGVEEEHHELFNDDKDIHQLTKEKKRKEKKDAKERLKMEETKQDEAQSENEVKKKEEKKKKKKRSREAEPDVKISDENSLMELVNSLVPPLQESTKKNASKKNRSKEETQAGSTGEKSNEEPKKKKTKKSESPDEIPETSSKKSTEATIPSSTIENPSGNPSGSNEWGAYSNDNREWVWDLSSDIRLRVGTVSFYMVYSLVGNRSKYVCGEEAPTYIYVF